MHKSKNVILTIQGKYTNKKSRRFCPANCDKSEQEAPWADWALVVRVPSFSPREVPPPPLFLISGIHQLSLPTVPITEKRGLNCFCRQALALYKPHVVRV